ncbi:hypothetical protein Ddc_14745 [Ditylenchus destructor]|nr:hypothetical protein Ddc_14745 [Ditylenchus destructor]
MVVIDSDSNNDKAEKRQGTHLGKIFMRKKVSEANPDQPARAETGDVKMNHGTDIRQENVPGRNPSHLSSEGKILKP